MVGVDWDSSERQWEAVGGSGRQWEAVGGRGLEFHFFRKNSIFPFFVFSPIRVLSMCLTTLSLLLLSFFGGWLIFVMHDEERILVSFF
jgi:hypothetical protein